MEKGVKKKERCDEGMGWSRGADRGGKRRTGGGRMRGRDDTSGEKSNGIIREGGRITGGTGKVTQGKRGLTR